MERKMNGGDTHRSCFIFRGRVNLLFCHLHCVRGSEAVICVLLTSLIEAVARGYFPLRRVSSCAKWISGSSSYPWRVETW